MSRLPSPDDEWMMTPSSDISEDALMIIKESESEQSNVGIIITSIMTWLSIEGMTNIETRLYYGKSNDYIIDGIWFLVHLTYLYYVYLLYVYESRPKKWILIYDRGVFIKVGKHGMFVRNFYKSRPGSYKITSFSTWVSIFWTNNNVKIISIDDYELGVYDDHEKVMEILNKNLHLEE